MKSFRKRLWDLRCRLRIRERTVTNFRNYRSCRNRSQFIQRHRDSHPLFMVQIGGGTNVLRGWLNTDLSAGREIVYLDATKRMPFPPNSVDYIFSEHMFEHISYAQGSGFLREAGRVLKPGGKVRIATPDLAFLIRLYTEAGSDVMKRYIQSSVDTYVAEPKLYEGGVAINNFFYSWGHRFIYDFTTISHALLSAGFVDIIRCRPLESSDPNLRNLESHGRVITEEFNVLETMVVEARKP